MADPGTEKEIQSPRTVSEGNAINIQSTSGGHGDDSDSEKGVRVSEKHGDEIERIDSRSSDQEEDAPKEPLAATRSYATDASVTTSHAAIQHESKPWYKKVNPMRWGGIPEIPKERIISKEYQAGFFSRLTFQWMNPLMTVSLPLHHCVSRNFVCTNKSP